MADLNDILGTLPSGIESRLDDDTMCKHLRESYILNDSEKARREKMRLRIDLYNDNGAEQINKMVDTIFNNSKVRSLRKKFIELANFQNLTKRIIREISSVYSEPADRRVESESMDERYQSLQRDMR